MPDGVHVLPDLAREDVVARWLGRYMFRRRRERTAKAKAVAKHFNDAGLHKSHGRRIHRAEARQQRLVIEDLETDQHFQDVILTTYHLGTLLFERSTAAKFLWGSSSNTWLKHGLPPGVTP